MKQFFTIVLLTWIIVSMFGCATGYWVTLKNGNPVDATEKRTDSLKCEREAATTYPYAQVITTSGGGSYGSRQTNCYSTGNFVNCDTSGGGYSAPKITTSDGNAQRRSKYYDSCMAALGYERVFVSAQESHSTSNRASTYEPYEPPAMMDCQSKEDCSKGLSCRSRKGGGTECR